ncbi:MAG: SsrA-binding protein, partial [Phycisphaerales bacterium]|nr:SsrA-binding protein [Phycisphaerales bacterium]
SIAEGYVTVREEPPSIQVHGINIGIYQPAGNLQHHPTRTRKLLAHKREIKRLSREVQQKGVTIVPLKLYFKNGYAKLLIGLAIGKQRGDKRQSIKEREMRRDMDRAMARKVLR